MVQSPEFHVAEWCSQTDLARQLRTADGIPEVGRDPAGVLPRRGNQLPAWLVLGQAALFLPTGNDHGHDHDYGHGFGCVCVVVLLLIVAGITAVLTSSILIVIMMGMTGNQAARPRWISNALACQGPSKREATPGAK